MFLIRKYRNSEFLSVALHNTHSQGETPGGESGREKIKGGPNGNGALLFFPCQCELFCTQSGICFLNIGVSSMKKFALHFLCKFIQLFRTV